MAILNLSRPVLLLACATLAGAVDAPPPEASPPAQPAPGAPAPLGEVATTPKPQGDAKSQDDRLRSAISAYEPVYFLFGDRGGVDAKFQFSLKAQLLSPAGLFAGGPRALGAFFFGYSQTSLWDLHGESKPFRDSSYRPELFYYDDLGLFDRDSGVSLAVQTGFAHESNGKSGTESRSINTLFATPILTLGADGATQLTIAPRLVYYIEKTENADITDYRGYGDLLLKLSLAHGWQFSVDGRIGTGAHKGSIQFDVSYPLDRMTGGAISGFLGLQYFDGYGETILDYDRRVESRVRIGYVLVR